MKNAFILYIKTNFMVSLGELMKIEGVSAAGEFTPDGKLIGHRENMNMPK